MAVEMSMTVFMNYSLFIFSWYLFVQALMVNFPLGCQICILFYILFNYFLHWLATAFLVGICVPGFVVGIYVPDFHRGYMCFRLS